MNIGLTGATGFIGRRIIELSGSRGHRMVGYSRSSKEGVPGCAETRIFSSNAPVDVSGLDAVIHLAGESVFGLWTQKKKAKIRQSRILGTRCVVDGFRVASLRPSVLVCSSAVGFYGDTGERPVDETAERGDGFLANVAAAWEEEARAATETGARVVSIRTGLVLGAGGGAMKLMTPVFRLGGGGELGHGQQWMSWIHLDDIARLYLFAVEHASLAGVLNGVAPTPVRNAQFTDAMAQTFHRPAILRVPAWSLRMALGGFSAEVLESKRVQPRRTVEAGFEYQYPDLEDALAASSELK